MHHAAARTLQTRSAPQHAWKLSGSVFRSHFSTNSVQNNSCQQPPCHHKTEGSRPQCDSNHPRYPTAAISSALHSLLACRGVVLLTLLFLRTGSHQTRPHRPQLLFNHHHNQQAAVQAASTRRSLIPLPLLRRLIAAISSTMVHHGARTFMVPTPRSSRLVWPGDRVG